MWATNVPVCSMIQRGCCITVRGVESTENPHHTHPRTLYSVPPPDEPNNARHCFTKTMNLGKTAQPAWEDSSTKPANKNHSKMYK
jgi:hypothetical protein